MKFLLFVILFLFFTPAKLFPQANKIISIKITNNGAAEKERFDLYIYADSTLKFKFLNSNTDTIFKISGKPGIVYHAVISRLGETIPIYNWKFDTLKVNFTKQLLLDPVALHLKTVVINGQRQTYKRGDTLVIPVEDIRTRPHSSATELIDKIPGFSAGTNGNITALGKKVQKIRLDGAEIFGGNPRATLENIKADMLKDVEIINMDGDSGGGIELNLRLKKDRKEGWYGEVYGQQGTSERNNAGVKLNKIKPGTNFSSFFNYNNQNQQVLSPNDYLKMISSGNEIRNTLGTQKLYYDFKLEDPFENINRVLEKLSFLDKGEHKTLSAGLNFSKTYKKISWNSYLLGNYDKANIDDISNTTRSLGEFRAEDFKKYTNRNKAFDATQETSLKWTPNDKNTISAKLILERKYLKSAQSGQLNSSLYNQSDSLINKALIFTNQLPVNSNNLLLLTGNWEHRYQKPAQKTTASAGMLLNKTIADNNYQNQLTTNADLLNNADNQVHQSNSNYNYFGTVQHSTSLSRKLLFDIRTNAMLSRSLTDRVGVNILEDKTVQPSLSLSTKNFIVQNNRITLQSFLFYKSGPLSIVAGAGALSSHWKVAANDSLFNQINKTTFLPGFYANYVFNKSKVSFRYTKEQFTPALNNLLPAVDSSMIQQVSIGNSMLSPYLSNKYEINSDVFIQGLGSVNLQINYALTNLPITDNFNIINGGSFPERSFTQFGKAKEITGTLSYFRFNTSKSINPYVFLFYLWRKQYQLNQQVVTPLEFSAISPQAGLKINFSKEHNLNLSVQAIINNAHGTTGSSTVRYNMELKDDNKLMEGLYYKVSTKWILINTDHTLSSINPIINFNIYKYFSKLKSWQVNIGASNLLNVNMIKLLNAGITERTTASYNYLSRYVNIGVTFYPERWKK